MASHDLWKEKHLEQEATQIIAYYIWKERNVSISYPLGLLQKA